MQKYRWSQQAGGHIREVDHLVERVQLAGVMERREDERDQAENVKVQRLVRTAAPEIDEQPDHQVGDSYQIKIGNSRIFGHFSDDQRGFELDAPSRDLVLGLVPRADTYQQLGN